LRAPGGPQTLMADQTHNLPARPWPANLAWATRLLLLAGLIGAVAWSWQATRSGQAWRAGAQLLQAGHYDAAVTALEDAINLAPLGGGPGYDSAQAHLSLSYAYLARRDFTRAEAVLPDTRITPALAALIDLQRARIAAARGDTAAAQAILVPATASGGAMATDAVRRALLWRLGETRWAAGAPDAAPVYETLARRPAPAHDPYTLGAWVRLATLAAPTDPAAARQALAAARAALPADPALAVTPDLHLDDLRVTEGLPAAVISDTIPRLEADLPGAAQVANAPPAAQALYWGHALLSLEAWPQAAGLLRQAVAADPTLADAHAYLGLAQERQGDAAGAEARYREALRLAPDRDLARQLLARLLITQHRWAEAAPLLDALLARDPGNVVAHLDRATWAQGQGLDDVAEAEYKAAEQQQIAHEALGTATPDAEALDTSLLLAQFYFVAGPVHHDCSLARDAAQRAVNRRPTAAALDALGWAQHLCGDDRSAAATLARAVAADPHLAAAQYHYGLILKGFGDPAARAALEAAQDLDPGGLWARRALSELASP
jgi:tetratricopeptide (TPR) repeat protein